MPVVNPRGWLECDDAEAILTLSHFSLRTPTIDGECLHGHIVCPICDSESRPWFREAMAWNNWVVPKLAMLIKETGDFDRTPILADIIEERGCQEPMILDHLRGRKPCPIRHKAKKPRCKLCNGTLLQKDVVHTKNCWAIWLFSAQQDFDKWVIR